MGGDGHTEFFAGNVGGALEHHVFQEMRYPAFAGGFVRGARLVIDRLGNQGRAVIRHHHHLQTVIQGRGFHRKIRRPNGLRHKKGKGRGQHAVSYRDVHGNSVWAKRSG